MSVCGHEQLPVRVRRRDARSGHAARGRRGRRSARSSPRSGGTSGAAPGAAGTATRVRAAASSAGARRVTPATTSIDAADAHDERGAERGPCSPRKYSLRGLLIATNRMSARLRADLVADLGLLLVGEVAVAGAGDREPRMLLAQALDRALEHLGAGAEEEDAVAAAARRGRAGRASGRCRRRARAAGRRSSREAHTTLWPSALTSPQPSTISRSGRRRASSRAWPR